MQEKNAKKEREGKGKKEKEQGKGKEGGSKERKDKDRNIGGGNRDSLYVEQFICRKILRIQRNIARTNKLDKSLTQDKYNKIKYISIFQQQTIPK